MKNRKITPLSKFNRNQVVQAISVSVTDQAVAAFRHQVRQQILKPRHNKNRLKMFQLEQGSNPLVVEAKVFSERLYRKKDEEFKNCP